MRNPLAVVTGASSGIGYELAKLFARNHYDLIIAAEDEGIHTAAHDFRNYGVEVRALQVDLSNYDGVETLFEEITYSGHDLDAIALNAGIGVSGEFSNTSLEQELTLIRLNIVSLVHLTKRILPLMIQKKHGRILFTSSLAAEMPGPYYAVYAASKAFVQSFSGAIREEVKIHNITVTALQPGATDTNFFERADMMDTKAGTDKKDDPAQVARHGFRAMMEGRDHVIAGSFKNKVQATVARFVSAPQGARMQGKSVKPGSASH